MNNFSVGTPVNLAPSGIATFAKTQLCTDLRHIPGQVAVLGAPFDLAIQGRTGTRLGPRGIRVASTRFSYKPGGSYDPERDDFYLDADKVAVLDCGDVDYVPGDIDTTFRNLTAAVSLVAGQGVFPVVLGGDHSVTYPVLCGLAEQPPFEIIHFDAHLDWTASVGGQTRSNGSPMRNAASLPNVGRILHIGIRGIGSSSDRDYADARAHGDRIYSPKQARALGIQRMLEDLTPGGRVFVTFDIDCMDAAVAPATGSPMFGGFQYEEIVDMLEAIALRQQVVGMDMVEVAPPYDDAASTTCYLAARLVSDLLGFVTKQWEKR